MEDDLYQQAVTLARSGQKAQARALLLQVLRDNPRREAAWIWLADCAAAPEERVQVLETCLRVIPDARLARMGLEKLRMEAAARTAEAELESQSSEPAAQKTEPAAAQQEEAPLPPSQPNEPAPPASQLFDQNPEIQAGEASQRKHGLPVDQFPISGAPLTSGRTQPVRVAKQEPEEDIPAASQPTGCSPQVEQAGQAEGEASTSSAARAPEPNPFTVSPGEYPGARPRMPVIKPLKAQIERRLERDLGLDIPLPPEPTQQMRIKPKQNRVSRGMILLYVALALIAVLGIAALLAGLILSGR